MSTSWWDPGSLVARLYWTIRWHADGITAPRLAQLLDLGDADRVGDDLRLLAATGYITHTGTGPAQRWRVDAGNRLPVYPVAKVCLQAMSLIAESPAGVARSVLADDLRVSPAELHFALLPQVASGLLRERRLGRDDAAYSVHTTVSGEAAVQLALTLRTAGVAIEPALRRRPQAAQMVMPGTTLGATHRGTAGNYVLADGRLTVECRVPYLRVTLPAEVTDELLAWLGSLSDARAQGRATRGARP